MPTTVVELAKILGTLLEDFPAMGRQMDTEARLKMFRAYHLILGDLDADLLLKAALGLVGTATFYPSAGELRRAYFDLVDSAAGIPDAYQAWAEVKALFRRGFSRMRPPTAESVSHPRVLDALEGIGGWRALCVSENDMADRARYVQAYEAYTKREQYTERMLPGVMETAKRLVARERKALTGGNDDLSR